MFVFAFYSFSKRRRERVKCNDSNLIKYILKMVFNDGKNCGTHLSIKIDMFLSL